MRKVDLHERLENLLRVLERDRLPGAPGWLEKNKPEAKEFIDKAYADLRRSAAGGDVDIFEHYWKKYERGWRRACELMAIEHVGSRDFMDIDLAFYQHLPDGYSFIMDSERLGCSVHVFPRKPKSPPRDIRWMTAGQLIDVDSCPSIIQVMETFDAWFSVRETVKLEPSDADKAWCKEKVESGKGMRLKRRHRGWDEYEARKP